MFGPFVTVTTFKDDEEALAIANGTVYGLGCGLWTQNLQRAHRFARDLHAGMVWVNCYKRVHPGFALRRRRRERLRPRDGLRGDARVHAAPSRVWINVDAQIPPHFER